MLGYVSYIETDGLELNRQQVYDELNTALEHLYDRGLFHAAKW